MINQGQLKQFSRQYKTNETVVAREYLQLLFLSRFYARTQSRQVFFKGGTALHLIYQAPRFSEDLDFTVGMAQKNFLAFMADFFNDFSKEYEIKIKERKTLAGKRFLLTASPSVLNYKIFINLDFSFREKVLDPQKSVIQTDFPVLFTSYVYHLSKEEILAEKIRAILTRKQGRDLYDLWYLLTKKVNFNNQLIKQKLKYYKLQPFNKAELIQVIETKFSIKDFVVDLRPFVPIDERANLAEFFDYVKDYLKKQLSLDKF